MKPAIGRFIVINKTIKDLSMHEVFTDICGAEIDKDKGVFKKRGSFKDLEAMLPEYANRSINCLYIMGALERDNKIDCDNETGEIYHVGNPDASPMAITCRSSISKLLGGDKDFSSLIKRAEQLNMSILIDSLARVSSSRVHR
jgi:hypothetical protein